MSWYIKVITAAVAFWYGTMVVRTVLECAWLSPQQRRQHMSVPTLLSATIFFLVFVWRAIDLGRYL